jgi:quinol monooxygenase YgiN
MSRHLPVIRCRIPQPKHDKKYDRLTLLGNGVQMTDPIVFISRNRIKEGKIDEFREHYRTSIAPIVANKPGTLVQLAYESEDLTEVTIIRLFPGADEMDSHLQGASERSKRTYEFIEPLSIEIYGTPSSDTLDILKEIAGSGISVSVNPRYIGGFIR